MIYAEIGGKEDCMKRLIDLLHMIILGVVGTSEAPLVLDNNVVLDDPLSSYWSSNHHDVGWYYV